MFRRDVKKRFNETKYNLLTAKGAYGGNAHLKVRPFHRSLVACMITTMMGFGITKRFMTGPDHSKPRDQPRLLANGDLHPYEKQYVDVSGYNKYMKEIPPS